jgi:hypothetical protein
MWGEGNQCPEQGPDNDQKINWIDSGKPIESVADQRAAPERIRARMAQINQEAAENKKESHPTVHLAEKGVEKVAHHGLRWRVMMQEHHRDSQRSH